MTLSQLYNNRHVMVQWLLYSKSLLTQNMNGLMSLFHKNLHREDWVLVKKDVIWNIWMPKPENIYLENRYIFYKTKDN